MDMDNNLSAENSVSKWVLDPSHSSVTFSVRHLMISKVKGQFTRFTGEAEIREGGRGKLVGIVDVSSITTNDIERDTHLLSEDFFNVEKYPTMVFEVDEWEAPKETEEVVLHGDLTIRDVTKPVTFKGELGGVVVDGYGNTKAAVELTATINRGDWGLNWNSPLETGGVLVGDEVTISIDAQAVLAEGGSSDHTPEPMLV